MLTWSLALATYRRHDTVCRCVEHVLRQTRLPSEIVIVDASDNLERTHLCIRSMLEAAGESIRLVYTPAHIASASAQRRQATELATADVVFVIDDDSFMYPDCAEQVMRVYESDRFDQIVGVQIMSSKVPPPIASETQPSATPNARPADERASMGDPVVKKDSIRSFKQFVRHRMKTDRAEDIFVPYDGTYPEHEFKWHDALPPIGLIKLMHGARMTFRRQILLREPFNDVLLRHCPDDSDVSYRASRHGVLVNALLARLCHVEATGGRIDPYLVSVFDAVGPLLLHRLYSDDLNRSKRMNETFLRRRLVAQFLKDIHRLDVTLPRTRAILLARRVAGEIFTLKTPNDAADWYRQFQLTLLTGST